MTETEALEIFRNKSNIKFMFVNEGYREYNFPDGEDLYIENVLFLAVSASGGHRLFSVDDNNLGTCYYVKPAEGWYIKWTAADGDTPHFKM